MDENLIPMNERTKDEQREIASKGGKASSAARRRKRTMREAAQLILQAPAGAEQAAFLQKYGIPERDCTNLMLIMAKAVQLAADGNLKAAEFIRDTIVAELFFNHSSTETFRDKLLKLVLADSSRLSASDGQEPEKTEILR